MRVRTVPPASVSVVSQRDLGAVGMGCGLFINHTDMSPLDVVGRYTRSLTRHDHVIRSHVLSLHTLHTDTITFIRLCSVGSSLEAGVYK